MGQRRVWIIWAAGATSSQMRACTNHHHHQGLTRTHPSTSTPTSQAASHGRPWNGFLPTGPSRSAQAKDDSRKSRGEHQSLHLLARIQSPRNVRTLLRRIINPPGPDRPQASLPTQQKTRSEEHSSADHARAQERTYRADARDPWWSWVPSQETGERETRREDEIAARSTRDDLAED